MPTSVEKLTKLVNVLFNEIKVLKTEVSNLKEQLSSKLEANDIIHPTSVETLKVRLPSKEEKTYAGVLKTSLPVKSESQKTILAHENLLKSRESLPKNRQGNKNQSKCDRNKFYFRLRKGILDESVNLMKESKEDPSKLEKVKSVDLKPQLTLKDVKGNKVLEFSKLNTKIQIMNSSAVIGKQESYFQCQWSGCRDDRERSCKSFCQHHHKALCHADIKLGCYATQ